MTDPNKGTSEITLRRYKEASLERFHIELFNSVKKLLQDFDMTWGDLNEKLGWWSGNKERCGELLKKYIGMKELSVEEINAIAHAFSAEPYIIFRPRMPFIMS